MLVKEVKPIGKVGENLLENKSAEKLIEMLIEKPLQKACAVCREKNIDTVMSSGNKNNIVKKDTNRIKRKDVIEAAKKHKIQTFLRAGKGYAWLMINYNTLSDQNREIIFCLEKELGEDAIWFVKSSYVEFLNLLRKPFRLKKIVERFDDKYADKFKEKQLLLMYNNKYPRRNVFIRMPINEDTRVEEVEEYFNQIIFKLVKQ